MATESKTEILNRLFKENGLLKEDYFQHSNYTILTRSGIEKVQYKNEVTVRYDVIKMEPNFCVVKAIATKEVSQHKTITIETFGSAGHNADGSHPKGKQFQYLYYPELAEKRALSRCILKICNFYELGVFGEDESDDFKKGTAVATPKAEPELFITAEQVKTLKELAENDVIRPAEADRANVLANDPKTPKLKASTAIATLLNIIKERTAV